MMSKFLQLFFGFLNFFFYLLFILFQPLELLFQLFNLFFLLPFCRQSEFPLENPGSLAARCVTERKGGAQEKNEYVVMTVIFFKVDLLHEMN